MGSAATAGVNLNEFSAKMMNFKGRGVRTLSRGLPSLKKLDSKSQKAFTLVEVLVSAGLAMGLFGAAVYLVFSFSRSAQFESTMTDLNQKMDLVVRQFETDLSLAVKVRGGELLPGVFSATPGADDPERSPRTSLREPNSQENDRVVMYTVFEKSFAVPLFDITSVDCDESKRPPEELGRKDGRKSFDVATPVQCFKARLPVDEVNAVGLSPEANPAVILQWNAQRFMNQALQTASIFFVSNLNFGFLLEKLEYNPPTEGTKTGTLVFKILFEPSSAKPARIDFSFLRIQALKRVLYQIDDQERLVRKEFFGSANPPREQPLLERASKFRVDYLFADRQQAIFGAQLDATGRVVPLSLPEGALSAPVYANEPNEPRLSWRDISAAQVRLAASSRTEFSGRQGMNLGPNCEIINTSQENASQIGDQIEQTPSVGRLICQKLSTIALADFESLLAGQQSSLGAETCLASDARNRCKPACASQYNNPDRSHPQWEGYRYHSSNPTDYCRCKGASPLNPEEEAFVPPTFNSSSENDQLNACIRSFGACTSGNVWKYKDPRLAIACDCIQSAERMAFLHEANHQILSPWPPSTDTERAAAWALLQTTLIRIHNQATPFYTSFDDTSPHFNPWMPSDSDQAGMAKKFKCEFHNHCHNQVLKWLNLTGLSPDTNDNKHHPFNKYCGCLSNEPSTVNGAPTTKEIAKSQKKWTVLQDPAWCPNLYHSVAPPYVYWQSRIESGAPNRQALIRKNSNGEIDSHDATLVECARSGGIGQDFRESVSAQDRPPNYPSVNPPEGPEASIFSKTTNLNVRDGAATTSITGFCAHAQCFARPNTSAQLGCCIATQLGHANLATFLNTGPPDPTEPPPEGIVWNKSSWQGYCHSRCPRTYEDVRKTQNYFLGRDLNNNDARPLWCGGVSASPPAGAQGGE